MIAGIGSYQASAASAECQSCQWSSVLHCTSRNAEALVVSLGSGSVSRAWHGRLYLPEGSQVVLLEIVTFGVNRVGNLPAS